MTHPSQEVIALKSEPAGWVSSEIEPPERTMVIANCTPIYGDAYVTECWFENGEFYDQGRTVRVSHWMRLPPPPNTSSQIMKPEIVHEEGYDFRKEVDESKATPISEPETTCPRLVDGRCPTDCPCYGMAIL